MKYMPSIIFISLSLLQGSFAHADGNSPLWRKDSINKIPEFLNNHRDPLPPPTASPSTEESALALSVAPRIVSFARLQLDAHLLRSLGPSEDVKIADGWKDLFRLRQSLLDKMRSCPTLQCIDSLRDHQIRFFNWVERIGVPKDEYLIPLENTSILKSIAALVSEKPKLRLSPSLVFAIHQEASQLIGNISFDSDFSDEFKDPYKRALGIVLNYLTASALDSSALNSGARSSFFFPAPRLQRPEEGFTPEWRYSENAWLAAITNAVKETPSGSGTPFNLPIRHEYAKSHTLTCQHPGTRGDFQFMNKVSAVVGTTDLKCKSGQGGEYKIEGASLGASLYAYLSTGDFSVSSNVPGYWVTPETTALGIEIAGGYLFGFRLCNYTSVAKTVNHNSGTFALGGGVSGAGISIVRTDSPSLPN